jgi:hypothetical protein
MARMKKKPVEVQKFGGTESLGQVQMDGYAHEVESVEAQSGTKLEHDEGHGNPAIIRRFTFGINPLAFKEHPPTQQELFNSHIKGIELALWRDGMTVLPEVPPRITIDQKALQYHIFVGAKPARGHILKEVPQTLSQIANG